MPQSNVPNAIALLDDARYKLERALGSCVAMKLTRDNGVLHNLAGALENVQTVLDSNAFKDPLSEASNSACKTRL